MVLPAEPMAPVVQYIRQGRKLEPPLGILLRQSGEKCTALQASARTCFKGLDHSQVRKLIQVLPKLALSSPPPFVDDVTTVVKYAFPGISEAEVSAILDQRNFPEGGHLSRGEIPEDVWDEVLEDGDAVQEFEEIQWAKKVNVLHPAVSMGLIVLGISLRWFWSFNGHCSFACQSLLSYLVTMR